ncbi:head GIN domain-containing protein [Bacteroidota bacterium]
MNKLLNVLFIVILLVQFVSCDSDNDICINSSGSANDYELSIDPFSEVSLSGPFNLRIAQDNNQKLVISAVPEVYEEMEIEVKGETLEVGFRRNITCVQVDEETWINITVPDINEIFISGASEIVSDGDISLDALQITISGTAIIELTGESNDQEISVSGIANASNFGLFSENVTIDVSGAGELEVYASETLDITVSGAATIKYKGSPAINQNISGTMELINSN